MTDATSKADSSPAPMIACMLFGALGGMAPTLSKLAGTYATAPNTDPPSFGIFIGLGLFALLGAIIAVGFGQNQIRQALIAGIAAPGIITNVLTGATDPHATQAANAAANRSAAWSLISQARAQPAPAPNPVGSRTYTIVPKVSGGIPIRVNIPVFAVEAQPGAAPRKVQVATLTSLSGPTVVTVPANATHIVINDRAVELTAVAADRKIGLNVTTKPGGGSDFLWALGANRTFQIDKIEVAR